MKVVCIKNSYLDWGGGICKYDIIIGKEYECLNGSDFVDDYLISFDNDHRAMYYPKSFFITKEEYRNKRLEEIGI
jgi:hypothetical protein